MNKNSQQTTNRELPQTNGEICKTTPAITGDFSPKIRKKNNDVCTINHFYSTSC